MRTLRRFTLTLVITITTIVGWQAAASAATAIEYGLIRWPQPRPAPRRLQSVPDRAAWHAARMSYPLDTLAVSDGYRRQRTSNTTMAQQQRRSRRLRP